MTKPSTILLASALISLLIGFTTDVLWGFAKPLGAILFGLFMIVKMLEREVAEYDREEELHRRQAERERQPKDSKPDSGERAKSDFRQRSNHVAVEAT